MLGLELVLITVLHLEGTSGGVYHLYYRSGDDAVLPCNSSSSSSCSFHKWLYSRERSTVSEFEDGKVVQSLPQAARLKMDNKCSLIVNNITAEDAGAYRCRLGSGNTFVSLVFLNVLTISPSSPAADPAKDGNVTLRCSLERISWFGSCQHQSFRWLDETGKRLTGEDVRHGIRRPWSCVSSLTVRHQSLTNTTYTCQFVKENSVKVEAHYSAGFKGIRVHIYHRAGDDAVLTCNRPSSSSSSCSNVNWLYRRDEDMNPQQEVQRGIVVQSSSKAARLSVDNNCSLIINNIIAEDAGGYRCQIQDGGSSDPDVYLNLMSISASSSDADQTEDNITLLCSLLRFSSLGSCPENSLLWVDETGTGLTGEGVGYQFRQTGCDSYLTVKLQSSSSRRYTCQFVDGNTVKIEAHYQLEGFSDWSPLSFIMLTLRITVLILMVGITADIIRTRGS